MSNVYCETCKIRPIRSMCDWCKIQTCKGCTALHACEAASMDMRQFADELKDLISSGALAPPASKEVEEKERTKAARETNMPDLPLLIYDHMQQETKIIDDYYIKRSKELEDRNNSLDNELKIIQNKFIDLEKEYKANIANIGHEIGAAYDAKYQETINIYNDREKQFNTHIAALENQNNQLIAEIQALRTPKPAPAPVPQKKQPTKPKTTF